MFRAKQAFEQVVDFLTLIFFELILLEEKIIFCCFIEELMILKSLTLAEVFEQLWVSTNDRPTESQPFFWVLKDAVVHGASPLYAK